MSSNYLSVWHEILDGFVNQSKKSRYSKRYKRFVSNLLSVSEGLRVGFLNDRRPFLNFTDSKCLINILKDKGLIKKSVSVLRIGHETLFVNVECLLNAVTGPCPSFFIVSSAEGAPKLLPHTCSIYGEIESLIRGCLENHATNDTFLSLDPPDHIEGCVFLGVCLGYPTVYEKIEDFITEDLVQYKLRAISDIPELSELTLFCFSIPVCNNDEAASHIDTWYNCMVAKLPTITHVKTLTLETKVFRRMGNLAI